MTKTNPVQFQGLTFMDYNIIRELKNVMFGYSDEKKQFIVAMKDNNGLITREIYLSKVQAFSLARFMVRIFQRNWFRRRK